MLEKTACTNSEISPEDYSCITELPSTKLFAYTHGDNGETVEDPVVYGALGCFEERSSYELWEADRDLPPEGHANKAERMIRETSGRGHEAVRDQSAFIFVIESLPRVVTLQLCQPQWAEHLQQSLRRANASKGFYLSPEIVNSIMGKSAIDVMNNSFELYEDMKAGGISAEDARIILPLATRTNIQSKFNARELGHLSLMSDKVIMPSIVRKSVKEIVGIASEKGPSLMKERENNTELLSIYPSAQLFTYKNTVMDSLISRMEDDVMLIGACEPEFTKQDIMDIEQGIIDRDEGLFADMKVYNYAFIARMSLMTLHQAIRQRTWRHSVESIYSAIHRREMVVPPSFNNYPEYISRYKDQFSKMLDLYDNLVNIGVPQHEAILVIPHGLVVYDMFNIDGFNAIYAIGKRTCLKAQWEVRDISQKVADILRSRNPIFEKFSQPQGVVLGHCPEKNPCGYCQGVLNSMENRDDRMDR